MVTFKLEQSDEIVSKLEEKLSNFYITSPLVTDLPQKSFETDNNVTYVLLEIKTHMDELKQYCNGMTNETLAAIADMRHEVLTASDKSIYSTFSLFINNNFSF